MAPDDVSPASTESAPVSPLQSDEVDAFLDLDAAAFGARMSKGFESLVRKAMTLDRVVASRDDGALAGSAASEHSVMTVPGLGRLPAAMVVAVAVLPSHRRQGRLRTLMRYQLDDLRSRGEVVAALYASEGGIYGRFGYGPATFGATYTIDKRVAHLARPARDLAPGRVRLVHRDDAAEAFPAIYRDYAPTRAGELDRGEIDYTSALGDPGAEELNRRFYAVYQEDDHLDAYVGYEVAAMNPPAHGPRRLIVHELCALTPEAYLAVWEFLLGIDLTVELIAAGRPLDEPVKWSLAEPRQLRCTSSGDRSWIRLVDVATCLAARHYATAGRIVIGVDDPFCPWNTGSYCLTVDEDWGPGDVASTKADPDLHLDASTLASIYLGGVSPSALGDAGRIRQSTPGSIPLAARMFANDRPPFCLTPF
ncbi:MAG: GNAT family N-acetyltransferase [Acidimicrobiales bacterium]|jgi:predicted acetyltransferase